MKRWVIASLFLFGGLALMGCLAFPSVSFAQDAPGGLGDSAEVASPGDLLIPAGSKDTGLGLTARKLAPGVMTIVTPDQNSEDTALGPFDLDFVAKHPELEWNAPDFPDNQPFFASPAETLLAQSRGVTFRHPIWGLEFAFKPVRVIEVDLPTDSGKMERKTVWYLLYRVRYAGEDLVPDTQDLADSEAVPGEPKRVRFESVRFIPRFTLLSKERNLVMDAQILAPAVDAIAARERVPGPLLDHVEIARNEIALSSRSDENAVWGVATWTDVDPALNFFAIEVRGLTNAYQINVDSGGDKQFLRKTLRIYFWRPGDSFNVPKDRVYLGSPAYENPQRVQYYLDQFSLKERLDYQWIYR
ncbi:MAG: hypothetical protein MUF23_06155 [Pirellula sp.]|nr:hypothetical protein [Pirellula sp.]